MKRLGVIVGFLICSLTGLSQATDSSRRGDSFWFNVGAGSFGTLRDPSGVSVILSYTQLHDSIFYTFRFMGNAEIGELLSGPVPEEEYYSYSFLFGTGFSHKFVHLNLSVGVGITEGIKRGAFIRRETDWFGTTDYYQKRAFRTPAIPLEIDLVVKPLKWGGVGVTFFGDLNFVRTYYGVALKLSLGRLR